MRFLDQYEIATLENKNMYTLYIHGNGENIYLA